jgi:glutamate--cysteine ligase regulatory subunit
LVPRNIVSGGPSIIRKPGAFRSNLELTNSLRSNFLAAQQDYANALSQTADTNGTSAYDEVRIGGRPAPEVWTHRDSAVLYIPRINWDAAGLQEDADHYEITVKIFFLATAPVQERARYTMEALALVQKELGVSSIDLLIASFPGLAFEGDCEWEADKKNALQGNLDEEVSTWAVLEELHKQGVVKGLGIAEFGSEKLSKFLAKISVRPVVDQINVRDCCNVPPPLLDLAKKERIELTVHSDCSDILPPGTLRELLGHGFQGAGVLADAEEDGQGLEGDLVPQWVVKYTALVKDRGVIENKGYFAGAEVMETQPATNGNSNDSA